MSKFKLIAPLAISLLFFMGTQVAAQSSKDHPMKMGKEKVVFEKNGIKLVKVTGSPDFPNAKLTLTSPKPNGVVAAGKVNFVFKVDGYDLGAQTGEMHDCANSGKGQHIHLILNDGPYDALYKPDFEKDLEPGGYVVLAFLSRSYHESVKHTGAASLSYFTVGDKAVKSDVNLKSPLMFYSRPKGEYKGDMETQKVLLDYFLANVTLSKDGYKVKATIDGTEFTFTKWEPYFIEGLSMGKHTIKLELVDKNGKTVANKFNPVERTITLSAE